MTSKKGVDPKGLTVYTDIYVRFDWDPNKSSANLKKHSVAFEDAITAFDDPRALITVDELHSSSIEVRESLIGAADFGVLVVIFTIRQQGSRYRIISARRANKKERLLYEKAKRISF